MAKPIFIITLPFSYITSKQIEDYLYGIQDQLYDYHILINVDGNLQDTKYQLFSDKEIEPIELEKLKEILNLKADEKN